MTLSLPQEPTPVYEKDDNGPLTNTMSAIESMKFKSKFDKHLSRLERIKTQLIQCFSKYYGQCDEDMKASLSEDPGFKSAMSTKGVISLCKMLMNINHRYRHAWYGHHHLWRRCTDNAPCQILEKVH